jgi:hypothetical protein
MLDKISKDVISFLLKAHIPLRENTQTAPQLNLRQEARRKAGLNNIRTSREELSTSGGEPKSQGLSC